MDIDKISINEKYNILMHGIMNKNITNTCKIFGVSRTIYYRWLKRYKNFGMEGLKNIERNMPKMPNEVPKYIEKEILKIVKSNPKFGPRRILSLMKENGFVLGESGIYNVLKRNSLNNYKHRIEFSSLKTVNKSKNTKSIENLLKPEEEFCPGYILIQSTNCLGSFKNIGRVYELTAIDFFSGFAFVKLYKNKKSINSKNLLETCVFPTFKHFDIKIKNIITNKSSEFTTGWEIGKHQYEEFLKKHNITHFYMDKDSKIYEILKDFQKTIYKELYDNLFEVLVEFSLEELVEEIRSFLKKYNFNMPLKEGINKGKIPLEVVTKDKKMNFPIPLWLLVDSIL